MSTQERITGFVPGGEDRTQWIFEFEEGYQWTEAEMKPLIDVVTEHVDKIRARHGWDVTNYYCFGYDPISKYHVARYGWRFHLYGETPEALAQQIREYHEKYG